MTGKVVLLTGATGVLGSVVAPLFLDDPETELLLLLRADSPEHAERRLDALVRDWGEPYSSRDNRARLRALRGDVTCKDLGLERPEYETQVRALTHIVHCAANVNLRMSESEARKISVDSARELLRLAQSARTSGRLEKLDFVSTLGVAGTRRGLIPEQVDLGPRGFHTTYESSKCEAEELVFQTMAEGLPVTVHRPSMIVGDASTGRIRQFQIFYYICEFLTGRRTAGVLPDTGQVQLDTVPVDFVAKAIKWSSSSPTTRGRLLHLCSGPEIAMSVRELGRHVRERLGGPSSRRPVHVPLPLFSGVLRALAPVTPGRQGRALKTLLLLLAHLKADQQFENKDTMTILQDAGLRPPPVTDYVDRVLDFYRCQARRG